MGSNIRSISISFNKGHAMNKFTAVFAGLMLVALSGCNTVAGIGKDVEKVGEKTQEVSKDTSKKIEKK